MWKYGTHPGCDGVTAEIRRGKKERKKNYKCGSMPNVMAALPNIGGALCSMPQSLADAQYWNAMQ